MGETKQKEENRIWYAVRTFYCKEKTVAHFLKDQGLLCFIPMRYRELRVPDGKRRRELIPAVHDLLFLEKTSSETEIRKIINQCPVPVSIICSRKTNRYYEIRDSEMVELRAICDPDYKGTVYVEASVAEARIGQKVRVVRGTFKGLEGKLTRYKNRYYVVITLLTMGVMVHVPKWYCEKIE